MSTWDQFGVLFTKNEVGTGGILDGTRQDSSEEAKQSWHDEGRPNSFASVVKNESVPRRKQANMSISRSIVQKLGIWVRSEDAWDLAMANLLTGSVDLTNQRFKEEVPGTPVLNMSGV